jgi:hypothetical protein
MDQVPLADFIRAWSGGDPSAANSLGGWRALLQKEQADNWALIIKRAK